jgi:hypothetical protein
LRDGRQRYERLTSVAEVDDEFAGWLAEAYDVGRQRDR